MPKFVAALLQAGCAVVDLDEEEAEVDDPKVEALRRRKEKKREAGKEKRDKEKVLKGRRRRKIREKI